MNDTGLLHHIELYVSNLDKSVEFWGRLLSLLGYSEYQRWDKGRSWKLGPTYLVLVQVSEKHGDSPYHRCKVGLNHLAFHAASREPREHVDDIASALRERGAAILYDSPLSLQDGQYALYFEDPDRIKVELVAR
jgi:catechol 2,3-dioxygenase-like lactoylglutathione lyase family enzyme